MQLAVLQALASRFDRDLAREIIGRWKSMSPSVRREAVEALFSRRDGIEAVIGALESRALQTSDLDPARLKQLLGHSDASLHARAQKILGSDVIASRDRNQIIAAYRPAVQLGGDREKGVRSFQRFVRPVTWRRAGVLTSGPTSRPWRAGHRTICLPTSLIQTARSPPNFVNYNVAMQDGRVVSGIIADESAGAITLKRAEGATDAISRDRIETISSTGLSLMPEGLEKGLSAQDLANVIAFVKSIRASSMPPPATIR